MSLERFFAFTDDDVKHQFTKNGRPDLERLNRLPCLFMEEGKENEIAHVGQISRSRFVGDDVVFEYTFDIDVPRLLNSTIYAARTSLDMPRLFEFSRNHWAVKDVDLYRFLLKNIRPRRQKPKVFQIAEHENIEPLLVSAMMPFDASFNPIYAAIQLASTNASLRCRRADDIWENPAVIQDVVSLIDRSRIVICDCTGRNPNVFYEAGIAHTLGREVILIAQSGQDIPFDLRHLRFVPYVNSAKGLIALVATLQEKMLMISGH
ncbi:hypothetical protein [Xanthomonas hortorum]|uniref:hypothetical protein n=1 Tax=Xanthomonas hortorum TaxID=56454 RepID=UPI0017704B23|nr:hypothetical protein [Xanthomonas hortorum]MCE4356747.1 hypothetical protein [Xanthomonas hortorum pv. taraxaci]CAD0358706.1 hypothetical protein NCPPB940_43070 [Xanthomonas hortorum pv. taraxaci]CAD0358711.1 hypothetical protein NCPPB940_43070 [Xanthomonas hortorum pv. taraxaci]